MDPNQRKRKAPPLPKFQQSKTQNSKVVEKVADFLQQISKQTAKQNTNLDIEKATTLKVNNEGNAKKFNLANLNSKLNSIMSNKKIDLNKVVETEKKKIQNQQVKPRRQIEIQYDPNNPNSYEQSKFHYVQSFKKLKQTFEQRDRQIDLDDQISKLITEYERNSSQFHHEKQEEQPEESEINKLDDRQSLALRMMQKFGFKVGDGLGKQSQGIKTPLTIKKVTDSSCKIQPSALSLSNFITVEQSGENALKAHKIEKSPVIVVKIVMKLNQLTEQVQNEIKEECEKYGKIIEWVCLYKSQQILFYCKYETKEQAFKTFTRINGRYYDQRVINVFFYPLTPFQKNNYNEKLHQIIDF